MRSFLVRRCWVAYYTSEPCDAVRHARQYHHPLAVQFENPQLRWCFLCNTLLHAKRVEDGSEQKDVLEDIAEMIKRRPSEGPITDVEAVWFRSGSVTSEIKSEASASISADGKGGCAIRGLNLLAMNRLRDYFLKFDGFAGPLTTDLKQLFTDTSNEASLKESVNPKYLFGSLCTKAPQFRGYQQQDSHELLRCLLDRLCTEELTRRKQIKSSQDGGKSLSSCPTFVDEIFGGRLSSTVSYLECGHTSVVYEPFLDLSLPVPTKKPPSKGAQSVSHAKISKPPKRSGKVLPKVSRDAASLNSQGNGEKSLSHVHPRVPVTEGMILPSDTSLESNDAGVMADNTGLTSQDSCFTQKSRNEETCKGVTRQLATVDDSTWLDFLEQDTLPNAGTLIDKSIWHPRTLNPESATDDAASEVDHILTNQGSETGSVQPVDPLQNNLDADTEMKLTCTDSTRSPNDLMCLDDQGQSKSPDCDIASEFSKKLLIKESGKISSVDSNLGTDSCTRLSEDEAPLQLQESEILLLPYKEVTSTAGDMLKEGCEVSSAAVGWEEDSLDLDGVGDLFNETESDAQSLCNAAVSQANGLREASFTVSNISMSDPEELDNTDAPVSVKSCLAYFTKPELLSKSEHAWQCENCTKVLKEKRMRSKNKLTKPRSHSMVNGHKDKNPNGVSSSGTSLPPGLRTHNGSTDKDALETFEDRLLSPKGTSPQDDRDSVSSQSENGTQENHSETSSQVNRDYQTNKVQLLEAPLIFAISESESENEDRDFKRVRVERDATKRILIDKVPPILSIHLKRFRQDARGRLSKLSCHVNFIDAVDLKPYVDTRYLQKDTYKYQLIGVVVHLGTMRGGHYVAYVRGGSNITGKDENAEDFVWYYASDTRVREVSLKDVLCSEAYILFYEET
ncbi:hypothetical protein R3W88_015434 [Solanum pinnatisectum]|uniref:Uncharacterized protein n=1 Tax=Solanum pinnatisectum TaxID=50273 RepID=A0AAV9KUY2_9SOLN|nr:hypothetical protein R3W88_015434 [Solanum pinnatisectum]